MRTKLRFLLLVFSIMLLAILAIPTEALAQAILPVSRGGTGSSSFTAGSVLFSDGSIITQDNFNFFWDDINNRLGIGTSSPTSTLSVIGNITSTSLISTADSTINSLTIGLGGGSVPTNTAIGNAALSSSLGGYANTAVGYRALASHQSGGDNTAVGNYALANNTTAEGNTVVGSAAMKENTTGYFNVAIGPNSLRGNVTGNNNTTLGYLSLQNNINGSDNIAIGAGSGLYQAVGFTTLTSPEKSIYIGAQTRGFDDNDSNSIVIGYNAIGAGANTAVIGNSSLGNVYFGSVSGQANIHAATIYSGSSTIPGCIVMGDTAGGIGYVTLNNGVLTVSATKPSVCQ